MLENKKYSIGKFASIMAMMFLTAYSTLVNAKQFRKKENPTMTYTMPAEVPIYEDENDEIALEIIAEFYPTRTIVPIVVIGKQNTISTLSIYFLKKKEL